MLEGILQPYMELTWIQVFFNVRIVGNRATQLSRVKFKNQNVSNTIVLTSQKTTVNSDGAARQMTRLTYWDWKQRRGSHALILSSAQTVKEVTKWTPTNVHSGDIGLTDIGDTEKLEYIVNQFRVIINWAWMKNTKKSRISENIPSNGEQMNAVVLSTTIEQ